jgi:methionyl aminopeptidase
MAIPIKTPGEIAAMRSSGRLAWLVVRAVAAACRPGVTTRELDGLARRIISEHGLHPLLLGYKTADGVEFPGAACICVNEEVVHAVPSDRIVREGDVVKIDVTIRDAGGWCADAATTVIAGLGGERAGKLVRLAQAALAAAMNRAGPGVWWSQVAAATAEALAGSDFTLVAGYCGHGVGRGLHEPPRLCFGAALGAVGETDDVRLEPGMVITIEPIVVESACEVVTLDDGWTVLTANRAWAAHEERTVAITRRGCEVLTAP